MDAIQSLPTSSTFFTPSAAPKTTPTVYLPSEKPIGTGRKSNYPYYKEVYGQLMKADVDEMMKDRKDIVYRYSVFCKHPYNMSEKSLYLRVNQSLRYLKEHLDPSRVYSAWSERIRVNQVAGMGVRISFMEEFRLGDKSSFGGELVVAQSDNPEWKNKMDDWLMGDEQFKPFFIDNLALSEEEVGKLNEELGGLKGIMVSVDSKHISIVKV